MTARTWLFAASALTLAGAPLSARAQSAVSSAFVARIRLDVAFLADSSRIAQDKAERPEVRAFATAEAAHQATVGRSIVAWTRTNTMRDTAVPVAGARVEQTSFASTTRMGGPPVDDQGDGPDESGTLIMGRSVAIEGPTTGLRDVSQRQSTEQSDLAQLREFRGSAFDTLYELTRRDRLLRLTALYRDYAAAGDDPELRDLAVRECAKDKAEIEALGGL